MYMNSSGMEIFRCLLRSMCSWIWVEFCFQKGAKLASKSMKNRSWGIKNRSWDVLAGVLELSWWPKPKTQEGDSVFWKHLGAILAGSWGHLGVFLASKRKPRASKKRSKNRSKFNSMLGSFFGKVLVGFGGQSRAKLAPKSIQNRC